MTDATQQGRVLPDPTAGCCCTWHSENRGGGYTEVVPEYEPACPEHSDHLYDPRVGMWVLRDQPDPLRAGVKALAGDLGCEEFDGTLDLDGLRALDRLRELLAETEVPRG